MLVFIAGIRRSEKIHDFNLESPRLGDMLDLDRDVDGSITKQEKKKANRLGVKGKRFRLGHQD